MEIIRTHRFDHTPEKCWSMFRDPDSHVAKFTAMGHRDLEVLESESTDTSLRMVIERTVDVDVPGFAKKVIKPSNRLRSVDEWVDQGDGTYRGTFELSTPGVPIETGGRTSITPDDGGSLYEIVVELKVNVPLIGSRIASYSRGIIERQLDEEFRLADEWLAGVRSS